MNGIGFVYMLADKPRAVIYIGVTSDLMGRVFEHKQKLMPGFTSQYGCTSLVWYERHEGIESAIRREKSLKRYRREWKINVIEGFNPTWDDLFLTCYDIDNPFAGRVGDPRDEPEDDGWMAGVGSPVAGEIA